MKTLLFGATITILVLAGVGAAMPHENIKPKEGNEQRCHSFLDSKTELEKISIMKDFYHCLSNILTGKSLIATGVTIHVTNAKIRNDTPKADFARKILVPTIGNDSDKKTIKNKALTLKRWSNFRTSKHAGKAIGAIGVGKSIFEYFKNGNSNQKIDSSKFASKPGSISKE